MQRKELLSELIYKTSRSGGKGGQNVNKVSSKVELNFDVSASKLFSENEKQLIFEKLKNRINKEGVLQLVVQTERSQLLNKQIAIEKFFLLLKKVFEKKKKRLATKPTKTAKENRIAKKKYHSKTKQLRKKNNWD